MSVSQTRIRVRYAETDQMGVVYYANFFIWFEIGRVELLRQLGFHYKQMEIDDDCHIPVVEANCRYKSPARYDDELLLETSVLALRRSVIKFGYRLLRPENEASLCSQKGRRPTSPSTGRCVRCLCPRSMWPSSSNSLSNRLLCLLLPAGCLCFAILLGLPGAVYAPDAGYYRLLALGQRGAVPAPFSARILGPAMAGWLGRSTGLGVDTGFLLLGIVCLVALLALVAGLLWSWRAPVAIFAAIFLMPFWVDIFHDYYLPDLLHAAILAAILLCLLFGHTGAALLLLFPAYLARESTVLVALCLIFACWRRIRLRSAVIGVLAMLVRRPGQPALWPGRSRQRPWHERRGLYPGQTLLEFLQECSRAPSVEQYAARVQPQSGSGRSRRVIISAPFELIGLCQPSLWGPARLLLAWFGIFGIGPALALALWRKMVSPASAIG